MYTSNQAPLPWRRSGGWLRGTGAKKGGFALVEGQKGGQGCLGQASGSGGAVDGREEGWALMQGEFDGGGTDSGQIHRGDTDRRHWSDGRSTISFKALRKNICWQNSA